MNKTGKNYKAVSVEDIQTKGRVTLHSDLSLTGSEISINELPPGVSVPFVHSHKQNEEVYIVIKGRGKFYIDGEELDIEEGSVIRVDPAGQRCIAADSKVPLRYICIQTQKNSLAQFTETDGIIHQDIKPSWLKG